eukprot:2942099-Alexandrium_andersonii.AAC.1
MPRDSGDDSEAFERFVYLRTAQRRNGGEDPDCHPTEDFKVDRWVEDHGNIYPANVAQPVGLQPLSPAGSG